MLLVLIIKVIVMQVQSLVQMVSGLVMMVVVGMLFLMHIVIVPAYLVTCCGMEHVFL